MMRPQARRPLRQHKQWRIFLPLGLLICLAVSSVSLPSNVHTAVAQTGPWSPPEKISGELGGWFPDVAADDLGNVHVVFSASIPGLPGDDLTPSQLLARGRESGTGSVRLIQLLSSALYYSRLRDGRWTAPNDIALAWAGVALRSAILAEAGGRLHLVHKGVGHLQTDILERQLETSLGPEDLWYRAASANAAEQAGAWSRPIQITTGAQGYFSDLAVDLHGTLHVLWTETDKFGYGLYYRHSIDGGRTWTKRVPLDTEDPVWWYRADLEVDSRGRIHAVWEGVGPETQREWGLTAKATYAQSSDGGKSWLRVAFPQTHALAGPQQPTLGVDGSGTILIVYREPQSASISFMVSQDGRVWSEPQPLPGVRQGIARPYDTYDMVTDNVGHVHLALVAYPSGDNSLALLHLEWDGAGWAEPSVVATSPPFPEYPRLAVGQGNKLHLVWFNGDKATIDRTPLGIWYSTATTSAPPRQGVASRIEPPPVATSMPTETSPAREIPGADSSPIDGALWVEEPPPASLEEMRQNQLVPLIVALFAAGLSVPAAIAFPKLISEKRLWHRRPGHVRR